MHKTQDAVLDQGLGRLERLRAELARAGLSGFIVPRADEHLGEYVPPSGERLAWLTGFTGSAGLAAVLPSRAAVFTDGRYVLQLAAETDGAAWERCHLLETPPWAWLKEHAPPGSKIGYDPWLISEETLFRYQKAGLAMTAVEANPVDTIWLDRPAPPAGAAVPHPLEFAGESSAAKRESVVAILRSAKQEAAVITDPASLAWLLNIRGADLPFTPVALGFGLIMADGAVQLFMEPAKLPEETRLWLGNAVQVRSRDSLVAALRGLSGSVVRVDEAGAPAWFAQTLRGAGAEVVHGADPCQLPKARKNAAEQRGARAAHQRDAIALCLFLAEMAATAARGEWTEATAATRLDRLRARSPLYRGESFPAISGAGEHGAVIHYRVSAASDRPIRPNELFLIDSGGQYPDGTTDVTRTVWTGPADPPDAVRERFTRVLRGHIAIATLTFPAGVAGPHLDAFARRALWEAGLDYDHGTGHGVGSYLSVHEGPVSLSRAAKPVAIAEGMIVSNEPGFYEPGAYGIRLENLLLVQAAEMQGAARPFLRFETLTLAPFDRRLVALKMLSESEAAWLDAYHARVLENVGPLLGGEARAWLTRACAKLGL